MTTPAKDSALRTPISEWIQHCHPNHVDLVIAQLASLSHVAAVGQGKNGHSSDLMQISVDTECRVTVDDEADISAAIQNLARSAISTPSSRHFLSKLCLSREQFPSWPKQLFAPFSRPWPRISNACRRRVEEVVGSKTTYSPLQLKTVQRQHVLRSLNGAGWSLMPFPWRVDCDDGRQFKLLKAAPENRPVLDNLVATAQSLKGLSFVPEIVDIDDNHLLVEFRKGEKADWRSPQFATAFGTHLGTLHQRDAGNLTGSQIVTIAGSYLSEIEHYRPSKRDVVNRARDRLLASTPDTVPTGTVYSDLKPDNFLLMNKGNYCCWTWVVFSEAN